MPENTRVGISHQPTSFGEARVQSQLDVGFDLSKMNAWVDRFDNKFQNITDEITRSSEALQEESEDKGFWGSLATWGTTLGCMALDIAGAGACTLAGAVAGGVTRIGVDILGDAESTIPGMPSRSDIAEQPDPKYYAPEWQDKEKDVQNITSNLAEHVQDIEDFNANEWKVDLLKQVKDSWNAYRLGYSAETKLGLLGDTLDPWQIGEDSHLFGWAPSTPAPLSDPLGVGTDALPTGTDVPISYEDFANVDQYRINEYYPTLANSVGQPLGGTV